MVSLRSASIRNRSIADKKEETRKRQQPHVAYLYVFNSTYCLVRQGFTHILFLPFLYSGAKCNTGLDTRLMKLYALHICFSVEITFDHVIICQLSRPHCLIITIKGLVF